MRTPIACTLTPDAAGERIEEWRRFLARSITAAERIDDRQLRLQLDAATSVLEEVVDLCQREKACCSFFAFSIELEADSSWLTVQVPPEASSFLDEFASLLPQPR